MMSKEAAPVGKVVAAPAAASAAKFVPSVQKQRVIPGMAPPSASAPAAKKASAGAAVAQKKPVAVAAPAASAPKQAAAPAAAPVAPTPAAPAEDSAEGREKRGKVLGKKLKAIQEIRAKQAAGHALEPEQVCSVLFASAVMSTASLPILALSCCDLCSCRS